jgi:heme/copper-type cytochrome/quinol oxidase subunit 3
MLIASGVTIIKFVPLTDILFYFGLITIILAILFLIIGIYNYNKVVKNIKTLYKNNNAG